MMYFSTPSTAPSARRKTGFYMKCDPRYYPAAYAQAAALSVNHFPQLYDRKRAFPAGYYGCPVNVTQIFLCCSFLTDAPPLWIADYCGFNEKHY